MRIARVIQRSSGILFLRQYATNQREVLTPLDARLDLNDPRVRSAIIGSSNWWICRVGVSVLRNPSANRLCGRQHSSVRYHMGPVPMITTHCCVFVSWIVFLSACGFNAALIDKPLSYVRERWHEVHGIVLLDSFVYLGRKPYSVHGHRIGPHRWTIQYYCYGCKHSHCRWRGYLSHLLHSIL